MSVFEKMSLMPLRAKNKFNEMAMTLGPDRLRRIERRSTTIATFAACFTAMLAVCGTVFASGDTEQHAKDIISAVFSVVYLIANIVGVLFAIVGAIRFAISQAQADGPAQQKALEMIAAGIALLLVVVLLKSLKPENWIDVSGGSNGGGQQGP